MVKVVPAVVAVVAAEVAAIVQRAGELVGLEAAVKSGTQAEEKTLFLLAELIMPEMYQTMLLTDATTKVVEDLKKIKTLT